MRAQYEEAVIARFLGQLAGIDFEGGAGLAACARRPAQITPVGGIADQRLVAARELLGEPRDDRLPLIALPFRSSKAVHPEQFVSTDPAASRVNGGTPPARR